MGEKEKNWFQDENGRKQNTGQLKQEGVLQTYVVDGRQMASIGHLNL